MPATVTFSGPIFDGRADGIMERFNARTEEAIAVYTQFRLRTNMRRVFKNPTGYYASRVQIDRSIGDPRVHDSKVVYGPWLEGISSRNVTTRFRGYSVFRRTTKGMQNRAVDIANEQMPVTLRELNG